MKKILAFFTVIIVAISLVACGDNTVATPTDNQQADNLQSDPAPTDDNVQAEEKETEEDALNWGVTGVFSARNEKGSELCYINLPSALGGTRGSSYVVVNLDRTGILYAGQADDKPAVASVANLFPERFEQVGKDLRTFYGMTTKNYKFTLNDSKAETIGEYEMHRFTGDIEFDKKDEHHKYPFVAYATTLKSNGAYAYWIVYDVSDGSKNGDLIAEHALNMAKTFREQR